MPAKPTESKKATAEAVALAQQTSDFTAEGSPPPGRVAKAAPQRMAVVPRASISPPARKGPAGRSRYG